MMTNVKTRLRWMGVMFVLLCMAVAPVITHAADKKTNHAVPGAEKTVKTKTLETGAALIQKNAPVDHLSLYIVGFHPLKGDPNHQMESHHFCHQVNEDFAQCALFDGNTKDARLHGIEYIISEASFDRLPEQEKQYWHPHNYEILSGQLIAPRLPDVAEKALMKGKINSYGKTWHVWNTASKKGQGDALPLGEPQLAWSFNHDGEVTPSLLTHRDEKMGVSTAAQRKNRQELISLTHPQVGVNALANKFPADKVQSIEGVRNKEE